MLSNEMLKGSGSLKKQSTNTFKHSKKTNGATGKTMSAIVAQSQSPQETSKGFHNTGNPTPVLVSSYNMASRSSPVRKNKNKKKSVTSNLALPNALAHAGAPHLPPSNRARVNATAGNLPTSGKVPQHVKSMGGVRRAEREAREAAGAGTVESDNKSHKDEKPKEPIFLPSTGIDLPFLKRRP